MRPFPLLALIPLFVLASCANGPEGSRGPGLIITDSGIRANTDRNERDDIIGHLTTDLDTALAPRWTSAVTISELPKWVDSGASDDGRWSWPTITAQVVLTGHDALPLSVTAVHDGVVEYLNKKVDRHGIVTVTVTTKERTAAPMPALASTPVATPGPVAPVAVAPAPIAPAPATPTTPVSATSAAVAPAATPTAPAQRTYTVQAGDTLADIATLFYGSPTPWREIVAANPGLDPAKLTPGQTLVIPPKP